MDPLHPQDRSGRAAGHAHRRYPWVVGSAGTRTMFTLTVAIVAPSVREDHQFRLVE